VFQTKVDNAIMRASVKRTVIVDDDVFCYLGKTRIGGD
jgi:hypothetical protein